MGRMPGKIAATERRWLLVSWAWLGAVLAAALVVRFVALDHVPGVNGDETVFPVHASEWRAGTPLSQLRTGTNLPMNPLFFGIVVALSYLLPISLWTVRLAAVLSSVLGVVLGLWAFRERGWSFAAVFALLMATLPIQLGYARLAWDPTAIPAVMVLALAAATRGRPLATALAFGLCLWVHPSSVFAAPILAAAVLAAKWPLWAQRARGAWRPRTLALAALITATVLAAGFWLVHSQFLPPPVLAALRGGLPEKLWARARDPGEFVHFLLLYAEFVGGPTVYRYMTGSLPAAAASVHLVAAILVLVAVIWGLLRRRTDARGVDRAVLVGIGLSLIAAYLVGGREVLAPHTERYAMFLVAPTCYVMAALLDMLARAPRGAAIARLVAAAVGSVLLLSFDRYFLAAYRHTDLGRHDTFRTGDVDPKQQALELIRASRNPDRITLIRAEDHWIYWPLRYLAGPPSDLQVTIAGANHWDLRYPKDYPPAPNPAVTEIFDVVWANSYRDVEAARTAEQRTDISGYERLPILRVYRQPSAGAQATATAR
jgi:hypothetical protein